MSGVQADEETPVLVVGGSLCGLSLGLFLAQEGVPCIVVERHSGTAIHPRARGITARSMELFARAGLEQQIRNAGAEEIGQFLRGGTLADKSLVAIDTPNMRTPSGVSPTELCACDQDRLEPILLAQARKFGADVRFHSEVLAFAQDESGVTVELADRSSGELRRIRAKYLVGADGTHSGVRNWLGIDRRGPGVFENVVSMLFRADLEPALRGRTVFACFLASVQGVLVRRDSGVWQLGVQYHPELEERPEAFTSAECVRRIRIAAGLPNLEVELVGEPVAWEVAGLVADRFQDRRVFLVGDAAHVSSPRGGLGGNTGIQDAHNLAWKLAHVVAGRSGPELLDSYTEERRPVAELNMNYSVARMRGELLTEDYTTVSLGYRYHSELILGEEHEREPLEDPRTPSGRPGTRAPHVPLVRDGATVSTLDLFGRDFVLLTGAGNATWPAAARVMADRFGTAVPCHRIGPPGELSDEDGRWRATYGVTEEGAVLVRPDGFIAWRSPDVVTDPVAELSQALEKTGKLLPANAA